MKTLFQIKETSASSVRHCGRVLSLIAVLTAFSSSAWAETYYMRIGNTTNPSEWVYQDDGNKGIDFLTDNPVTSSSSWSWNFSVSSQKELCWGISTSNTCCGMLSYKDYDVTVNTTNVINPAGQQYGTNCGGGCSWQEYSFVRYQFSAGSYTITYSGGKYTISDAATPTPTETPIVYWEKYPTIGNNTIDMFGYLAERYCSTVTEAGFYWKETNDITADDIANPATNHKFTATTNPAKNNDSFSRTPDLSTIITEPTTIYLVNYVTTAGGGTGISDVVALAYSPCFPIPDGGVTFNNNAIRLPKDYNFTFEVTARSAGKTPVYKWYLDDALIEGAASNTYEFTMDEADSHTLKVVVTGDCEVSREATAHITSCTMPAVTLAAETSTTPWTDVIITATPTAVASAEWSVEPKAELSGTSTSGATFRAGTPGTYTVKYVGASSACDATVNAEAEIEITVNADSEDCTNPSPSVD